MTRGSGVIKLRSPRGWTPLGSLRQTGFRGPPRIYIIGLGPGNRKSISFEWNHTLRLASGSVLLFEMQPVQQKSPGPHWKFHGHVPDLSHICCVTSGKLPVFLGTWFPWLWNWAIAQAVGPRGGMTLVINVYLLTDWIKGLCSLPTALDVAMVSEEATAGKPDPLSERFKFWIATFWLCLWTCLSHLLSESQFLHL